jgi:hypothetical protein
MFQFSGEECETSTIFILLETAHLSPLERANLYIISENLNFNYSSTLCILHHNTLRNIFLLPLPDSVRYQVRMAVVTRHDET